MGINGKVRGDKEEVLWGKDRGGLKSALHSSGTGIKELDGPVQIAQLPLL